MKTFKPLLLMGLLVSVLACKPDPSVEPGAGPVTEQPNPRGEPTAVGQPTGPLTTQTIGPAGGTLTTPDGKLKLTFPPGALAQETAITARPVQNTAFNGVGTGYEFGPHGTTFSKPVTLTYHYGDAEIAGATPEAIGIAFQDADRSWKLTNFARHDPAQRTLTAPIHHFSWWALVTQFKLEPEVDTVLVGDKQEVRLMYLSTGYPDWAGKEMPPMFDLVAPLVQATAATQSTVRAVYFNGREGYLGSAEEGTFGLKGGPNAAFEYTAPPLVPAVNPVAISVELEHKGKAKLLLVSNLHVKSKNAMRFDGTNFDRVSVNGALVNGQLQVMMVDENSNPLLPNSLTVMVEGPKVGSFPFSNSTGVAALFGSASKAGGSGYEKCNEQTYSSGSVTITRMGGADKLVEGYVSGTLVTLHEEDEKCRVLEHKTMQVQADFSFVLK